jgi:diguanylate cyclase (GGDEF)-like protein
MKKDEFQPLSADEILSSLIDLTKALRANDDFEESLTFVAQTALALLPAEGASVRLFDEKRENFLTTARAGLGVHVPDATRFKADEGLIGWVAETGLSALVPDAHEDKRFVRHKEQIRDIRSILCIPLAARDDVFGVLGVTHTEAGVFTDEHRDLLELLGTCAVSSIEVTRLMRLSHTDPLTLVYNRRYLDQRLEEEVRRCSRHDRSLSVAILDLDKFKSINDTFGHIAGDLVLQVVADILRANLRIHDIISRWGGDEFVIIMPETALEDAQAVVNRLVRKVRGIPISVTEDGSRTVTASVTAGVAELIKGDTRDTLFRRADEALIGFKKA